MFRLLTDAFEDPHAKPQFGSWNIGQQLVAQFRGRGIDLRNGVMCALTEMHRFASAIVRCRFSLNPTAALQPVQQVDESGFFDAEPGSNFGLGKRAFSDRQMQESAPLSLTEADRFQALIEFEAPGAGDAMEKRAKGF
jgi:hypothetical protein